ncbi:MAG TPA: hypothetical protein VKT70_12125 [Stellaceae bacterium]|nr:hypothetical protein [Stellaceae bacterium]
MICLILVSLSRPSLAQTNDDELIKRCTTELEEKLFGDAAHEHAFITAQNLVHDGERVLTRLSLASGEGRTISGTCVFRGGKLFDVR